MGRNLRDLYPPKELRPDLILPLGQVAIPERVNMTEELLGKQIRDGRGQETAIYFEERRITFNELMETVDRLGNSLLSLGVKPGDVVGVKLVNQPEAHALNFAILKIGAVPVLLSRLWSRNEDMHVLKTAGIKVFFVSQSLFEPTIKDPVFARYEGRVIAVEEGQEPYGDKDVPSFLRMVERGSKNLEAVKVPRDSAGLIMFTSGTTGAPKGCLHSVGGMLAQGFLSNKYLYQMEEGDIMCGSSAVAFAAGYCIFMVIPFTGRGSVSLVPKFQPDLVLGAVQKHRATILTGVPASYRRLLEFEDFDKYDLSSLRLCTCGADAIKEAGPRWKAKTGLDIWEGFGSSELFFLAASNKMAAAPNYNSCGIAYPGWTIKCLDDEGRILPPGEVGHLATKGPTGCMYAVDPDDPERSLNLQRKMVKNGWTYTGDLARIDEGGCITFASREDDMIKSGGFRIYPGEIEEVVMKHPAVKDACVIGIADPVRGQDIIAVLVLEKGSCGSSELEEELNNLCKRTLSMYKIPRSYRYVEDLPKTPTGKTIRKKMREALIAGEMQ